MASVDLALNHIARRHPDRVAVSYYRLGNDQAHYSGDDTIEYLELMSNWEAVKESDSILYWGDFHQMRSYLLELSRRRQGERGCAETVAKSDIARFLLLEGEDRSVVTRAVAFGGTLLHNASCDYVDSQYREALSLLISNSRAWWVRDPYSAADVARMTGRSDANYLGFDCSLFLGDRAAGSFSHREQEMRGPVGVFLGRGYGHYNKKMTFASALARRLGVSLRWLPWMPERGANLSRRFRLRYASILPRTPGFRTLPDLLSELAAYRAVVTDTYHVAVNAWRLGVPAICLGHHVSSLQYDVSSGRRFSWRDKRFTFYAMYGIQEFYVHPEELDNRAQARARLAQLSGLIANTDLVNDLSRQFHYLTPGAEELLLDALTCG
jgi:hypothetical protein